MAERPRGGPSIRLGFDLKRGQERPDKRNNQREDNHAQEHPSAPVVSPPLGLPAGRALSHHSAVGRTRARYPSPRGMVATTISQADATPNGQSYARNAC